MTVASPPGRSSRPGVPGPVLFARYAYGPNRLGYCGPDDAAALLGEGALGGDDRALRELARGFEGAYPYLELIASANGIADPLDARVVEAYWLGNGLTERVSSGLLARSIEERFRRRLPASSWRWLAETPAIGARPVHAYHVLDVFPRLGLLRGGEVDGVLRVIDSCRIRWGRVIEWTGDWLVVGVPPLELVDGRLQLGDSRPERVQGWRDGVGFLDGVVPGDVVAVHWDWACDRLDGRRLRNLVRWTERQLEIANRAI
jgi:hypothetical protein